MGLRGGQLAVLWDSGALQQYSLDAAAASAVGALTLLGTHQAAPACQRPVQAEAGGQAAPHKRRLRENGRLSRGSAKKRKLPPQAAPHQPAIAQVRLAWNACSRQACMCTPHLTSQSQPLQSSICGQTQADPHMRCSRQVADDLVAVAAYASEADSSASASGRQAVIVVDTQYGSTFVEASLPGSAMPGTPLQVGALAPEACWCRAW